MDEHTWHARLRRDRLARNWSQHELARQLISSSPIFHGHDEAILEGSIKRWESGKIKLPRADAQEAIARLFGTVASSYFAHETATALSRALSEDEATEVITRLRSSSVDGSTLDLVRITLDQLCVDYAQRPAEVVVSEATDWLRELERIRNEKRLTLSQTIEIYDLTGWLALLVSCLRYDTGDDRGAERMRRLALALGEELHSPAILGWSHEISAWMALTQGDPNGMLAAVRAGLAVAKDAPVAVQLHAHAAKAWARIGDRTQLAGALDRGRELLERVPVPSNPRNHFVVDPMKWDFYAMDCARRIGDDALAWSLAETVERQSTTPAGLVVSPMRFAEAQLTKAAVEARAGEVEPAVERAVAALEGNRHSLPSLITVGQEVGHLLATHPTGADFRRHLAELRPAV